MAKKVKFESEGKFNDIDTVILTPCEGAQHHSEDFEVKGHQATALIQKGYATFKEVKKSK